MTPRGTDWGLATLVGLLAVTGLMTWFAATPGERWVFVAHDALGFALALLLIVKARRVWPRLVHPGRWDRRAAAGLAALTLVVLTLGLGWAWASGADAAVGGYRVLFWHGVAGAVLAAGVLTHALLRAKRPRRVDVVDRRQFLTALGFGAGALALWSLQRPVSRVLGLGGDERRFTGSYERGSFAGNAFPTTSWVSDDPRPLDPTTYRLRVAGAVAEPIELTVADLDAGDELVATLDCTGGFYTTQRWRGTTLGRVLNRARPLPSASHVRVISHTGYRASYPLAEARALLLATTVGDEPLSHGHGAPCRLVAPQRRGFQWIKWVARLELHDGPDLGAIASTIWSSFTPAGRGEI